MGASLSATYASSWQLECAARFNCTSDGLVTILGQATSCPANSTIQSTPEIWGITYEACQANCGMDMLIQKVEFSTAAIPLTTWLLPWIALMAQLPFEADGWMDLLSACLCIGSPALATYSLALTTFNRGYIATKFHRLKEMVEKDTQRRYHYMVERINAAGFILQECQQCPMRANQRTGELAELLVLNDPDRQNFWKIAAKDLKNTRRGFTYSFLAQVILAFLTYLISFIAAVHDSLGSPDVGLQFASSTVWSWMFPIVFGYIRVGSQYKAGAIKEALVDNVIIPQRDDSRNEAEVEFIYQKGLRPNADLYPRFSSEVPPPSTPSSQSRSGETLGIPLLYLHASTSQLQQSLASNQADDREPNAQETSTLLPPADVVYLDRARPPPTWWSIDVRGDERREGPIFNYARIFTWFAFADHLGRGFETSIEQFRGQANIPVTSPDAAERCGFQRREDLVAFMSWSDIPPAAIHHICYAALLSLFVQWGTTGAAIFVAYYTPFVGIGCRSGSYLIYGIAATTSWLLLVFSSFISHALMQRLEQEPERNVGILGAVAVITRLLGKALAIANAGWLIASSVLEDIGTFQTCCGWTPVFKGAADLRNVASDVWIGGFMWSIVVCFVTIVIFAYGRH
ncbi:hypothetical protein B0H14DRAFT_2782486 [Mycena olivaceomarginata]|nr:hypothetical protein B0H14DRAFT_2782486 [Mycena olivaceomarginata]